MCRRSITSDVKGLGRGFGVVCERGKIKKELKEIGNRPFFCSRCSVVHVLPVTFAACVRSI